MNCPICGENTLCINSAADADYVYRCRQCVKCRHKFYTEETENPRAKALLHSLRNGRKYNNDKDRKN